MTEEMKLKRDELAEKYSPIKRSGLSIVTTAYYEGFSACYDLMRKEITRERIIEAVGKYFERNQMYSQSGLTEFLLKELGL